MKKKLKKLIFPLAAIIILTAAFFYDSHNHGRSGNDNTSGISAGLPTEQEIENTPTICITAEDNTTVTPTPSVIKEPDIIPTSEISVSAPKEDGGLDNKPSGNPTAAVTSQPVTIGATVSPTITPKPVLTTVPTGELKPVVSSTVTPEPDRQYDFYCYFEIECGRAVSYEGLNPLLRNTLPKDGVILKKCQVGVYSGETVFDILKRVCREYKISLEYSSATGLGSAYIEGIADLYEFDCGNLSGWIYLVNGNKENVGCSNSIVKKDDFIRWRYTCDLGKDL